MHMTSQIPLLSYYFILQYFDMEYTWSYRSASTTSWINYFRAIKVKIYSSN